MVLPDSEFDESMEVMVQRGYLEEQIRSVYDIFKLTAHSEKAKIFTQPDFERMYGLVAEVIGPVTRWLEPQSSLATASFASENTAATTIAEIKEVGGRLLDFIREEIARPLIPPDKEPRTFQIGEEEYINPFPCSYYSLQELAHKTTVSDARELTETLNYFTALGRDLQSICEGRIDEARLNFQPNILRELLESAQTFIDKKDEIEMGLAQLRGFAEFECMTRSSLFPELRVRD